MRPRGIVLVQIIQSLKHYEIKITLLKFISETVVSRVKQIVKSYEKAPSDTYILLNFELLLARPSSHRFQVINRTTEKLSTFFCG
jgi:hypothetical protein